MPFPNFHSARLKNPGMFLRIRQVDTAEDGAIRFIGGPLKSDPRGPVVIQAIRFAEGKYTVAQARAWLKEHDKGPILFEEATKEDSIDPCIGEDEVLRVDRSDIGKVETREDGSMFAEAVVTRSGIFRYRSPDGGVRAELRPADEVFHADSLATAKMLPVTDKHPEGAPFVTPANAKKLAVGWTGENVRRDGQNVIAPVKISTEDGIAAVKAGRNQLSLGYKCRVVRQDGVHEGKPYTHVQQRIRYNHLALVSRARAGAGASLRLDALDAEMVVDEGREPTRKGRNTMDGKVRLDNGIAYDAAPEVVVAFEALQKERGELQTKLDAAIAEKDTATGERDELKAKVEELEKKDNSEEIKAGVKERSAIEAVARKALSEEEAKKLDSMTNDEIVAAVITSKHKDLDLEGKSNDYLRARFDTIAETIGDEQHQKNAAGLAGDGSKTRTDGTPDEEGAKAKAIAAMQDRSRGIEKK